MRDSTAPFSATAATTMLVVVLLPFGVAAGRGQQSDVKTVVSAEEIAALMEEGETIYSRDCATCHGPDGSEGAAPALVGSIALGNKDNVIRQVLTGVPAKGMPPFAPNLNDRGVAAVSTFIRGAWDNTFGPVSEADVKRLRDEIIKR